MLSIKEVNGPANTCREKTRGGLNAIAFNVFDTG
jgi:hypothetical protein